MDWQEHLSGDLDRAADEVRHGIDDPSVGAVFDGDNSVPRVSALHFFEYRRDRCHRMKKMRDAEILDRSRIAVGMLGAKVGHPEGTEFAAQGKWICLISKQGRNNLASLTHQFIDVAIDHTKLFEAFEVFQVD